MDIMLCREVTRFLSASKPFSCFQADSSEKRQEMGPQVLKRVGEMQGFQAEEKSGIFPGLQDEQVTC